MTKLERDEPWTFEEFYETFSEPFQRIARKVNWEGSGEDELDIVQFLWEHFWGIWDKAQTWSYKLVMTRANKEAAGHAAKERTEYTAFRQGGVFVYTREIVNKELYMALWDDIARVPDPDMHMDLNDAVMSLGVKQREALFRYYFEHEKFERGSSTERNFYFGLDGTMAFLNRRFPGKEIEWDDAIEDGPAVNITGYDLSTLEEYK